MKKIFKYAMISLGLAAACSCAQEEILFDHEQPAFETRDELVLIEAIMPTSTASDDAIYICGDFNNGSAAVDNINYQLEKSETVNGKWAIYLDPAEFVSGTSLEDGFWFYSKRDRREVTMKGEEALHKINAQPGSRYTIYVDRWESYYDAPAIPIPSHTDSYRIWYVNDNEWDPVNLYMYGDVNDLGAGWPGIETGGTATLGENLWAYIDVPKKDAQGCTEHLIFNGNGGKVQIPGEIEPVITFGDKADYFFAISSDESGALTCWEVTDIENPGIELFVPSVPVVSLYVLNFTEWEKVYAYAVNNDEVPAEEAFGKWPGAEPVETVTKDGLEYLRFEFEEQYAGHFANFIFNNGGSVEEGTMQSVGGPGVTLEADMTVAVSAGCYAVVEEDEEVPYPMTLYVIDETGWDELRLYAWGDAEMFGGWPGAAPSGTVTWNGKTYTTFEFLSACEGFEENLIFNNNNGTQLGDLNVRMADGLFVKITLEGAQLVDKEEVPAYIYIENKSGWDEIAVYSWGDAEVFGGWPGATPVGDVEINGFTFTAFEFGDSNVGKNVNLIFNNNNHDLQLGDFNITLAKENFLTVTADGVIPIEKNPRSVKWVDFLVKNDTEWPEIAVYAWGDAEMFGGWPGATPVETVTYDGDEYLRFRFSDEFIGLNEHFIFNNNGKGDQLGDFDLTVSEGMVIGVTAGGASFIPDPRSTYSIYVKDNSGWGELAVYGWQTDEPEIFGSWAGAVPSGTVSLCGETYKRYKIGDSFNGKSYNLIFNNNGGGLQYDVALVEINSDLFFVAGPTSAEKIEDPGCCLFFEDKTGWAGTWCYAWGDAEVFGAWPGYAMTETMNVGGVDYKFARIPAGNKGKLIHPILNDYNTNQYNVEDVVISEDVFFTANADAAVRK